MYSICDALSDIGGLIDILKTLFSPAISVLTFLFSSGIDSYLVESLFKTQMKVAALQ